MGKKYTSFEEIDKDLKRLHLQSEISKEELKLSFHEVRDSVTPSKLIAGVIGSAATGAVIFKLLTPLISFGIGKLLKRYRD